MAKLPLFTVERAGTAFALTLRDALLAGADKGVIAHLADVTPHTVERWARADGVPSLGTAWLVLSYLGDEAKAKFDRRCSDDEDTAAAASVKALAHLEEGARRILAHAGPADRQNTAVVLTAVIKSAAEIQAMCWPDEKRKAG